MTDSFFTPTFFSSDHLDNRDLPHDLRTAISMISVEEKAFLYGLARDHFTGQGAIVDAGIFLGASTRCFFAGLQDNLTRKVGDEKAIQSYEYAIATQLMVDMFTRRGIAASIKVGDSFEHLLRQTIEPCQEFVDLHIGDIQQAHWPDRPIEVLFLDVIKTEGINRHVLESFFPYLIPGHSIVVQQDYFVDFLPFIKLSQESLASHFEFVCAIGPSAAFRLTQAIPVKKLREAGKLDDLPQAERLQLLRNAEQRCVGSDRGCLTGLSAVHHLVDSGDKKGATTELARLESLLGPERPMQRLGIAFQHARSAVQHMAAR